MGKKTKIGDSRTIFGKNINTKLDRFVKRHPGSAEAKFLKIIQLQQFLSTGLSFSFSSNNFFLEFSIPI